MRKILYILVVLSAYSYGCTTPAHTAEAPSLKTHKTIAVLPFQVIMNTTPPGGDDFDAQQMEGLARYMSTALQYLLYEKLNKKFTQAASGVNLQAVNVTNTILSDQKISFAVLFGSAKQDICKLLNVDAVISTQGIFTKAPAESMAEVTKPFWSVKLNTGIFDMTGFAPVWKFSNTSGNARIGLSSLHRYEMNEAYARITYHFVPPVERVIKKMVKAFPYQK